MLKDKSLKKLIISVSNTGGLSSIQQLIDTTSNEIFSFKDSTSEIKIIPIAYPLEELEKERALKAIYHIPKKPTLDKDSLNWLKIAEKSFKFWDNEIDEIWNNV